MAYKLVVVCDVCGKEFKVAAEKRRRRRSSDIWDPAEDTSLSCNFNLMSESQKDKVDGNTYGAELFFETVCRPCRTQIKMAVNETVQFLRKGKTK